MKRRAFVQEAKSNSLYERALLSGLPGQVIDKLSVTAAGDGNCEPLLQIVDSDGLRIRKLVLKGSPDVSSKIAWMNTVPNGLVCFSRKVVIEHLIASCVNDAALLRAAGCTIERMTLEWWSGDGVKLCADDLTLRNVEARGALAVFPYDAAEAERMGVSAKKSQHPDLVQGYSLTGKPLDNVTVDGIRYRRGNHRWSNLDTLQGVMFTESSGVTNSRISNIDIQDVVPEHGARMEAAQGCIIENVTTGAAAFSARKKTAGKNNILRACAFPANEDGSARVCNGTDAEPKGNNHMSLITEELLRALGVDPASAREWVEPLESAALSYGLNTPTVAEDWLAQLIHESEGFTKARENLYYTTPQRLVAVWPTRFSMSQKSSKRYAPDYVRNPQKLANAVYSGRMGNGSEASGDGYRFGGGGAGMLTGRDMWQAYADFSGNDVVNHPELFDDKFISADSAGWMFAVAKGLVDEAQADLVVKITKRINGGTIGLAERQALTRKARQYFVDRGYDLHEPVGGEPAPDIPPAETINLIERSLQDHSPAGVDKPEKQAFGGYKSWARSKIIRAALVALASIIAAVAARYSFEIDADTVLLILTGEIGAIQLLQIIFRAKFTNTKIR